MPKRSSNSPIASPTGPPPTIMMDVRRSVSADVLMSVSFPLFCWLTECALLTSHKNMFDMLPIAFRDGGGDGPASASLFHRRGRARRLWGGGEAHCAIRAQPFP